MMQYLCFQRFFSVKQQTDDLQHGLNHNKYIVTDSAVYIGGHWSVSLFYYFTSTLFSFCWSILSSAGNHDFVGSDFALNAGVGLVIAMTNNYADMGGTILEQVKVVFERDWLSRYAKSLPDKKHKNLQQVKIEMEKNEWNDPL